MRSNTGVPGHCRASNVGQPVLIIIEATDNEVAYVRGACDPLQRITEEDVLNY